MKVFVLILLMTSTSLAFARVKCNEFQKLALELEKDIQNKKILKCEESELTAEEFGQQEISPEQIKLWNENRCKTASEMELALKVLENEIALYDGIEKLVNDVKENQEEASSPALNQEEYEEAVKDFEASLAMAYSVETFVTAPKDIIRDFSEYLSEDRNSLEEFNKKRRLICNKYTGTKKVDFCSKDFAITEEALEEINAAIKLAQSSEDPLSDKQIDEMRKAMEVTVNGDAFSFKLLKEAFEKSPAKARDGHKVIANLPKFESTKDYIKAISEAKALVVGPIPRFQFALEDLKKRQEWEMKSKFSVIKNQNPSDFKDISSCKKIGPNPSLEEMKVCTNSLSSKDPEKYKSLDEAVRLSQEQITRIENDGKTCSKNPQSEECNEIINRKTVELTHKYQVIKRLRDKLFETTVEVRMKDYVLQTLNNNCTDKRNFKKEDLSICNDSGFNLDTKALGLTLDVVDITLVFTNPDTVRNIDDICSNSEIEGFKTRLCGLSKEVPPPTTVTPSKPDSIIIPGTGEGRPKYKDRKIKPRGGNEAMYQALKVGSVDIINSIAQTYGQLQAMDMAQNYSMPSPYTYTQQPYSSPPYVPLTMADTIMYNAKTQANYGTYTPVMSYSSVGSNVATISPYKASSSSYFSLP